MEKPIKLLTLRGLTPEEKQVLQHLAEAWNAYVRLAGKTCDDITDFRKAIHDAERIVMARPAQGSV